MNHFHSHLHQGLVWHNVIPRLDGTLRVTVVNDQDRSQRLEIPASGLWLPSVANRPMPPGDQNHAWCEGFVYDAAMQPAVRSFLEENGDSGAIPLLLPRLLVLPTCGALVAGRAFDIDVIEISSWMLGDRSQAEGTLNHELAHCLVAWCKLRDSSEHGERFQQALKAIAPLTWRRDMAAAVITPAIKKLWLKHHSR